MSYKDYFDIVMDDPLASIVKISDLIHNLATKPKASSLQKYQNALTQIPIPSHIHSGHLGELKQILAGYGVQIP
jgi:hypothetical protein